MIPTERQRADALANDIRTVVGTDPAGFGECILPNLRDALGALAEMCRDISRSNEVDISLFAGLMYIARGEADRLALLERLKPEHRDILNAAIGEAAAKIVENERLRRRAA